MDQLLIPKEVYQKIVELKSQKQRKPVITFADYRSDPISPIWNRLQFLAGVVTGLGLGLLIAGLMQ